MRLACARCMCVRACVRVCMQGALRGEGPLWESSKFMSNGSGAPDLSPSLWWGPCGQSALQMLHYMYLYRVYIPLGYRYIPIRCT